MDTTESSPAPAPAPGAGGKQTTNLSRRWLAKMAVFTLLLIGLGVWGLYDALYAYPMRGEVDAEYQLRQYLTAADDATRLTYEDVKVDDPAAELADLRAREGEIAGSLASSNAAQRNLATFERAKLEWLRSMSRMWRLEQASERIQPDVRGQLRALNERWTNLNPPKPLSSFDLLFQWGFVAIGFGGALVLIVLFARVASKRFAWEPATHTLTLPGGKAVRPSDLKDIDKRRWHKFYVTLLMEDGSSRTLDLYRYTPLEEWILEMERVRFPERAAEEAAKAEAERAAKAEGQRSTGGAAEAPTDSSTPPTV